MKQIKTFEGACKVLAKDPVKVLPKVTGFPKAHQKALISFAKLIIVCEALNFLDNGKKPWKADWNNFDEDKFYPWWYMNEPGFRLVAVDCGRSGSDVGARLVCRTRALAEYAAKQFKSLYKDIMVLE